MTKNIQKFIVITSIFAPTEAIKKFSKIPEWNIIMVGDKKTPPTWKYKNVTYLSIKKQEKLGFEILKILPWNHYSRKMIGYLYAIKCGAEIIYDTDDDNIPLSNWHEPTFEGTYPILDAGGFVNIYSYFTKNKIWPRGFPLQYVATHKHPDKEPLKTKKKHIGIWQFLANNDPDVDAIYRMTDNTPVVFKKGAPIVLAKKSISPINSQNTFFTKEAFPLLYLPAFVTFRFTDILRGLVAQPILWTKDLHVGFDTATVVQKRNPHNYLKDFESEIPVFLYSETVTAIAGKLSNKKNNFPKNLLRIYSELEVKEIVTKKELKLLNAWNKDVQRCQDQKK